MKLKNSRICAEIDETAGADIVRLHSVDATANLLNKRGLQSWLKRGEKQDTRTGVFTNFAGDFRSAAFDVVESASDTATFRHEWDTLRMSKRVHLEHNRVRIRTTVENVGTAQSIPLQLEHFNMVAGARLNEKTRSITGVYDGANLVTTLVLEPFAQRRAGAKAYADTTFVVALEGQPEWLRIAAANNTEKASWMMTANILTRGFNSEKFRLAAGECFTHEITVAVEQRDLGEAHPELLDALHAARSAATSKPVDLASVVAGSSPVFDERWSQLCLQYDLVRPDDIKRIIDGILLPLRYNGVLFELDRGVRTQSHPELAPDWALSMGQVRELMDYAKHAGLRVGLEYNTPGHQNETNIQTVYPDLMEPLPADAGGNTLCLKSEQARQVVSDVIGELARELQPDLFHVGADEAQLQGCETSFGHCPRCRDHSPDALFAEYIDWLLSLVEIPGMQRAIWSDMFLTKGQFGPMVSGNGSAGNVWKSLQAVPSDVQIMDWHYFPADSYGSLDFFGDKGYRPWPVTAFDFDGIRQFLIYAETGGFDAVMHTTWAVPNQEKLPIESMVWHGIYHILGRKADDIDVRATALDFCRRFWQD